MFRVGFWSIENIVGEHDDAISRVDDLIDMVSFNSIYYVVHARATSYFTIWLEVTVKECIQVVFVDMSSYGS